MEKRELKQWWAVLVLALLTVIAVSVIDIALVVKDFRNGVEVELLTE